MSRGTCSRFVSLAFRRGNYASATRFVAVFLLSSFAAIEKRTNSRLRVKKQFAGLFFTLSPLRSGVHSLQNLPNKKEVHKVPLFYLVGPEGLEPPTKAL